MTFSPDILNALTATRLPVNIGAGLMRLKSEDPDKPKKNKKREFVKDGRENWGKFLDYAVDTDKGAKLKDIIYRVAKETGIRPEVLFASAMEEGLQGQAKNGRIQFEKDDKGNYIDSYKSLGLDNVGTQIDKLNDEGYLSRPITYQPYKRMNDAKKPTEVTPAYFDSLEDALHVKAAFLNKSKKLVNQYIAENKLGKFSDDAIDFIAMQAYNGGEGILPKVFDKYTKNNLLSGEAFLTTAPTGSYDDNQTYYNTRKRYDNMKNLQEQGFFDDYNTQKPML